MKKSWLAGIILIFVTIFFLRLNYLTFKNGVEVGDIVEIYGRVDAGQGKIEKINNKIPKENIYFIVDKVEDGSAIILGEIKSIDKSDWGMYYEIEPSEVKFDKNLLKEYLINKIKNVSKNYSIDFENFLRGTILGETYLIDNELKEMFRYTGTAHILVISGLHIGVIISGILYILLKFNFSKSLRYILTWMILTIYIFAIGNTPSVFRAYIMGSIYILGNILYEKVDSKKSFIVSLIASLLIYPTWIYSISFLMSYTAVFGIIYIYDKIPKFINGNNNLKNKLINTAILTITVQICMTPIFYIFFKKIPFLSFISNLIVVPIASSFIILSFITVMLSNIYLDFLLAPILHWNYIILIKIIELLNEIPYLTLDII